MTGFLLFIILNTDSTFIHLHFDDLEDFSLTICKNGYVI
jgi:hypothetical protein